jgi:hypothetical protein
MKGVGCCGWHTGRCWRPRQPGLGGRCACSHSLGAVCTLGRPAGSWCQPRPAKPPGRPPLITPPARPAADQPRPLALHLAVPRHPDPSISQLATTLLCGPWQHITAASRLAPLAAPRTAAAAAHIAGGATPRAASLGTTPVDVPIRRLTDPGELPAVVVPSAQRARACSAPSGVSEGVPPGGAGTAMSFPSRPPYGASEGLAATAEDEALLVPMSATAAVAEASMLSDVPLAAGEHWVPGSCPGPGNACEAMLSHAAFGSGSSWASSASTLALAHAQGSSAPACGASPPQQPGRQAPAFAQGCAAGALLCSPSCYASGAPLGGQPLGRMRSMMNESLVPQVHAGHAVLAYAVASAGLATSISSGASQSVGDAAAGAEEEVCPRHVGLGGAGFAAPRGCGAAQLAPPFEGAALAMEELGGEPLSGALRQFMMWREEPY